MSSYDWEEVKRLAADFQRAQLSSTVQKLTERNCIEIVSKLVKLRLLDVVFSDDGKFYITPQHLLKELKDELYVHGGRLSMIDAAKELKVDLSVIQSLAQDVVKEENAKIILGQFITHSYVSQIAEEINEKLQQSGYITVNDLTRTFNLPGDFIHSVIKEHMGRTILNTKQDRQDANLYCTEFYIMKNKSTVRGAILALTKPTPITSIAKECGIDEHTFYFVIDGMSDMIPGTLTDRYSNSCTYVPRVYVKLQTEWVKNTFSQNGLIEYRTLERAGITEPKAFISTAVQEEGLVFLENCAVVQRIIDQVESAIEDVIMLKSWSDIMTVLPLEVDKEDAVQILSKILKKDEFRNVVHIFADSIVISEALLNILNMTLCDQIVGKNVQEVIDSGQYEQYMLETKISRIEDKHTQELSRKDERKKRAAMGKSGGGTQGRETKTKSVKKKYGHKTVARMESDEDERVDKKQATDGVSFEIVTQHEIRQFLERHPSFDEDTNTDVTEIVDELTNYFYPLVNRIALQKAQVVYEDYMSSRNNSLKKIHSVLQDTALSLHIDIKLYMKGLKHFEDKPDVQQQLSKYLLKSTCTQLANICFTFISDKNDEVTSSEGRISVLSAIRDKETKEIFTKLNKATTGDSLEEFLIAVEDAFSELNMMTKKFDKKKEKSVLELRKKVLMGKLEDTEDPALVLHLASLIMFQIITENMVHASGKFVNSILNFLQPKLPNDVYNTLHTYHGYVLKMLSRNADNDDETGEEDILEELKRLTPSIKNIVTNFKKSEN